MRVGLWPGSIAYAIVTKLVGKRSASGERREVVGAARVEVLDHHVDGVLDRFRVRVLTTSRGTLAGEDIEIDRGFLFAVPEESEMFRAQVARYWPSRTRRIA